MWWFWRRRKVKVFGDGRGVLREMASFFRFGFVSLWREMNGKDEVKNC